MYVAVTSLADLSQTKTSPRQIQFVVWILERTIDLMPPGVETLCLVREHLSS